MSVGFLFFLCREITDKAAESCHGVSLLECLMQGCTFAVLCFIDRLAAVDHRRRNHGKVVLMDFNKTFQVVEKDTWKTHRARNPPAVSLWAARQRWSHLYLSGLVLNPHPSHKTDPSALWKWSVMSGMFSMWLAWVRKGLLATFREGGGNSH